MNAKAVAGLVIGLGFLGLFAVALIPSTPAWPTTAPAAGGIGDAMWGGRSVEVLLQGFVLLGGVVAVLLLLGTRRTMEAGP